MSAALVLMLAALPLLLLASGFFSGTETALFSLTQHQRTRFARSGALSAAAVTSLLAETRPLLITLLLGNMLVNVLYINISAVWLLRLSRRHAAGPLVVTGANVGTLLLLILLGEVLPKLVAARMAATWSRVVSLPLLLAHRTSWPLRAVLSVLIITPLARLIAPRDKPAQVSAAELESLLTLSQRHGVIDAGEEELLQQVLELSQLKVRDLMTPRVDIQAYDLHDPPEVLMSLVRRSRLRHIPAYEETLDRIVGLIYARQALLRPPKDRQAAARLVRQVKLVPEQQRADRLLVELRKTGATFAMVVDEYGGTAGLITLEDVVEHMVGDIAGAFEPCGHPHVQPLGPGRWRVSADLLVHDWPDVLGSQQTLPGATADHVVSTVGGLVMVRLGRVPRPGDRITLGNVAITVDRMAGTRLEEVLIELLDGGGRQPQEP